MKLYSYVVDHDFGFAPNPFHGVCTLATCKPKIRQLAAVGDYVLGVGCSRRGRSGHIVYFMRVDEITCYDEYWNDPRFAMKRPLLKGSRMQAFGDNIYHRDRKGEWQQANSFHSLETGPNPKNLIHDTKTTDRVLIGRRFAYWGGEGMKIPDRLIRFEGHVLCGGRGHRCDFPPSLIRSVIAWFDYLDVQGFQGKPLEWRGA